MLGYEMEDAIEGDHADTLDNQGVNVRKEQPDAMLIEVRVRCPGRETGS
ncbi:hypothetical protein CGRA01v4_12964 [Colletotrichum graminicola]|nr:hypothetical protein CGRA01v4_12964 [Colletotrichum graminicola]